MWNPAWRTGLQALGVFSVATFAAVSCSSSDKPRTHDEIAGPPALTASADQLKATIVTPHLEVPIVPGKNILWCSTFQLAWNELCDLAGGDIHMQNEDPMVAILNKRSATKKDIDTACYVALAGTGADGIADRIQKALQDTFKGAASPRLFSPQEALGPDGWVAYAYLFKNLPFEWQFQRLREGPLFRGKAVEAFGFHQLSREIDKVGSQVVILDYREGKDTIDFASDNFIVELKTTSRQDRLLLAMVPPAATFAKTIASVQQRTNEAQPQKIQHSDTLVIPVLNFDITRSYHELCGRPIISNNPRIKGTIEQADQIIRFKLDESGAVLKSEAVIKPGINHVMVVDRPFLILLQRTDAANPYFALWVDNAELLVPCKEQRDSSSSPPK